MSDIHSANGPIIVWINYGLEGWSPHSLGTEEEAAEFILSGYTSSPTVVTKKLKVTVEEAPDE